MQVIFFRAQVLPDKQLTLKLRLWQRLIIHRHDNATMLTTWKSRKQIYHLLNRAQGCCFQNTTAQITCGKCAYRSQFMRIKNGMNNSGNFCRSTENLYDKYIQVEAHGQICRTRLEQIKYSEKQTTITLTYINTPSDACSASSEDVT